MSMQTLTTREDLVVEQVGLATGDYLLIRRKDNFRWLALRVPGLGDVEVSLAVGHSNFRRYCRPIFDFPESLLDEALRVINYFEQHDREQTVVFAREVFGNVGMSIRLKGYCP